MKLALIPPIDLLDLTSLTEMQLMLPHLVSNDRYAYTYHYHCKDPEQFVILDNGEAEGVSIDPNRLLEIAFDFAVDQIVVPDTIGDATATMRNLDWFIDFLHRKGIPSSQISLMFVAQGKNLMEVRESIHHAMNYNEVHTIGLPRHLLTTTGIHDARHQLVRWFQEEYKDILGVDIHLLGGSPNHPTEIRQYKWPEIVRSTDTSSPFNFAYRGFLLRIGNQAKRPFDYFNLGADEFDEEVIRRNVQYLREWTGDL